MGSVGNPNPWSPYDNFKDCSLQICSIYCPQFCYFIFPPPPPSGEDDSTPFSPLIIAIIGVLASAFLLVSYYTIVTRFCRRRTARNRNSENEEINNHHDHESTTANHDQWQVGSTGLDEAVIETIPFCKYVRGDGLIEGTECAVCLSEFQENESLRLLPKCSHAFHLPCIDTWLKSHSNCPLCRAGVGPVPAPAPAQDSSIAVDLDASNADLVLAVNDIDDDHNEEDDRIRIHDHDEESVKRLFRRSVSLGAFTIGPHFLISEVLKIEGNDGSSRGGIGNLCNRFAMRRSVSTGRIP